MNTIDYVYRFDPKNPSLKPSPPDAEAARRTLEDGNRMFSQWMESCRTGNVSAGRAAVRRAVQRPGGRHARTHGQMPKQAPFAVVVGCSDARVPTEMLFGQGFNDLFVIRVAGNVLGDVCLGSDRLRPERPERERQGRRHARPQRLRRGHGGGRCLPPAAEVLVEVDLAHAPLDPPADLRRRPRGGQRPEGGLGARRPGACPATARP